MAKPKALIHEYAALRQIATALLLAGPWHRDGGNEKLDRELWDKLRVALHHPPTAGASSGRESPA